ncbi:MAG: arginine--tRNA ligase, partial [Rickettsiales bacterium]|nr:arginine--tRNA ligase [Rickettsiales bacterium]
ELSKQFHNYWSLGNIDYKKKIVISNNKELTNARLYLINNIQIILKDGLDILKIEAPEEM